jgi:hypothetical protein
VKRVLQASAAAGIILCGAGCALFGTKKQDIPEATLPSWIGRVIMVETGHRFVLVDVGAGSGPAAGTAAMAYREKRRTAQLIVTKESRPPYIAMEVIEGGPALGDQVVADERVVPPVAPTTQP